MGHCGYITTLKDVRPHPNADKLVLATCFGNTVCVAKDQYFEGEIGVYFETDLQLSMEFCEKNGLLAVYENGVNISGGYMDPNKRNVRTIKLRGEPSDGLFLPLACLEYTGINMDELNIGTQIDIVNGHEICRKYIPRSPKAPTVAGGAGKRVKRRAKRSIAPQFFEHKDTEQLRYFLMNFKCGDHIEITRKLHGTSGRTGHLPVLQGYADTWPYRVGNAFRHVMNKIAGKVIYEDVHDGDPIYDWGYVSGTRRTVLENYEGGFYGDDTFREKWHKFFESKLWKGETVYYEIVGFIDNGTPIMAPGSNAKVGKDFVKKYGDTTIFSYGCSPDGKKIFCGNDDQGYFEITKEIPQNDVYVYRMTMTNEDGEVVEYTPDFMRYRCEQIGVKTVPVEWAGLIPQNPGSAEDPTISAGEWVMNKAELYFDGPEPIDPTHIREGVVVRIINRPTFTAYKHKNVNFKIISGIAKEQAVENNAEIDEDILAEL